MSKEQNYKAQLQELGIYEEAFDPAIHSLAILERELSRTMKAWKEAASDYDEPAQLHPLYSVIRNQRRDIADLRDSLGLTPKGLQKLRGKKLNQSQEEEKDSISSKLDALANKCAGYEI